MAPHMDRSLMPLGFLVDAHTYSKTKVQERLALQARVSNKHKLLRKEFWHSTLA
jgi:hypothetical protein